ncbi:GDSL-like Lipase/Acylhydrolase superfamily protein [Theobroma cacao]|uniref:GDSL-like Lipase/Acylhydrolase superfamily protein n=1 Tax=Theobroma cacao TaxID=3641 RepID=A0A061G2S2_THECC|nr:GDSL-like Lipase/Acylhydrolase superfamily protein [Theobroma cacao]
MYLKEKMKTLKTILNPVFFVILILLSSHVVPSFSFTSFVFGDSLVDAGNNDYLFTLSKADSPPYGIDFKPSGGQPTGRFTNGRTIADIVDQALGAKSFPPPYLAPNTQTEAILRGINYASGASGILDETGFFFIGRIPLGEQVKYFGQNRNYMVNAMGENRTREFLKKAIFSLTIGSNDILNYVQPSIPFLGHDKLFPTTIFLDSMISNLTIQLKRLHELGARKLLVVGVGPLGCIPFVRAFNLLPSGKCSAQVNALIQGYNEKLKELLNRLNQEMGPEAIFVFANSYDIFMKIIVNYHQYGFENAHEPCCGGYFPPFICFKSRNTKASTSAVCNDRSKYVFWDAYHPTEAANLIIAKELLDGDESSSSPINIRKLYNYNS